MAAETSGKKKKKAKGKTVGLSTFLSDPTTGSNFIKDPPKPSSSWADATEELDPSEISTQWPDEKPPQQLFDRSILPSAPRASSAPKVDRSRLPTKPPYTVYLGNLSFECTEEDIMRFFERRNINVLSVRLPMESGTSRMRGFGYAELESTQAIMDALSLSGESLRGRRVNVDIADGKNAEDPQGDRDRWRDRDDRTPGDWRRGGGERSPPPHGGDGYDGDRYSERRGRDYYGGGGGGWDYDRPPRSRGGYGGRREDRYEGYRDRGEDFGRRRDFYDRRDDYRREDRYDRHRDYGPPRRYDEGRRYRDSYDSDRRYSQRRSPEGYSDWDRRRDQVPAERLRLQLRPRTKPLEDASVEGGGEISTQWLDEKPAQQLFDRSILPSAPRASLAPKVDRSRLPTKPPYTVYLGNLSFECTEEDIMRFFERRNINVLSVRLPMESRTGRMRGFGYAELESTQAIMDALSLSGESLRGRRVNVDIADGKNAVRKTEMGRQLTQEISTQWPHEKPAQQLFDRSILPSAPRASSAPKVDRSRLPTKPPYTVYLGNLSFECTEEDIMRFFERRNINVLSVRLPMESGTSRMRGFGYAELESTQAIMDALSLSGESLRGRRVNVDIADIADGKNADEERHLAALKLAIQQKGSLDKTIMQCAFVGPPRSGKSSLMTRIVGEHPTPFSTSTGVVNKVVQVVVRSSVDTFDSTWDKLSHDDEAVIVVMDASQVAGNEPHLQATVPIKAVPPTERRPTMLDDSVSKQSKHHSRPTLLVPEQGKHQAELTKSSSANSDEVDPKLAVSFCRSALRRNLQNAEKILRDKGWLVYLTDTGGQIEFQELLPVLVSGPSLFFLVFRLDHDLNKRFTVVYVRSNGTLSEPYQSTFTVKEALLQSLASIASMVAYINRGGEQVPLKSQVFFVGTHKDMVSDQKIDRIDRALQQLVTTTGLYRKGIIQFGTKSRMLLAVNNLSDDDSDIQQIRAAVERLGKQGGFNVRAPPSWLIFSLIIRQQQSRVLSYEKCFEVARQCGITSREELNETLWFLHTKVGLIRHFQGEGLEDLQKIVIQDPQVLFDMITDLVVETFTFDKADPVVREDFEKKGIFPFSIFKRISGSSGHLLTPSRLVNLLEHLHIIAPLEEEGEKKYFMPCVLSHAQPAEAISGISGEQSTEPGSNNSSLLIGFRCGYCPKGLFAALVVYLLANKKSSFQWSLEYDRIFKDQISFSVGPHDMVTVTVHPKFFEINCIPKLSYNRCFSLTTMCGEVRRCIETGISEVTSALHYTQDTHYLAFYCPGDHRSPHSTEPHPAEIIDIRGNIISMATSDDIIPRILRCELAKGKVFKLPPGHERWFTKEHSGRQHKERQFPGETVPSPLSSTATGSGTACPRIGDRPELWQLQKFVGVRGRVVRVMEEISADWEKLALALHFRGGVIRTVRKSEQFQVEKACCTILHRWLDGKGLQPVTWGTLVECLEDIDHWSLAGNLRKELDQ